MTERRGAAQHLTGLYPGTFDPVTRGHEQIMLRAAGLCQNLVIGVAQGGEKRLLFPLDERLEMVRQEVGDLARSRNLKCSVLVLPIEGLLVDFARQHGVRIVIRGLRAISDFEYEFQMNGMNRRLEPRIETVFLMASDANQFIASRLVREIAALGGDVSPFVSPHVAARLRGRLEPGRARPS